MWTLSRRLALGSAAAAGLGATGLLAESGFAPSAGAARAASDLSHLPLFDDPRDPLLGNPHGTLPMAAFFDYRCTFCRRMHPLVTRLLADEHDIRFVAKEWPIFGGPSVTAARVSLAASWQGRFAAVNDALFTAPSSLDAATIRAAARQAGVDMGRLDRDLAARSAEIDTVLGRVSRQAAALGLQGTPGFVIGTTIVPGALSYQDLRKVVTQVRGRQRVIL